MLAKLNSLSKWLMTGLGLVLIIKKTIPLVINPALFMDEGYYLGATQAVMNGDWLLHHYAFDKSAFLAYLPIPGIILLGETPLGFHFVSWVLYLVSFFFCKKIFEIISGSWFLSLMASVAVFLLPIFLTYGVSNFCEPYIFFFSFWLVYELVKSEQKKIFNLSKVSKIFFAAVFVKYSFILWAPVMFFYVWTKDHRPKLTFDYIKKNAIEFILYSKWIIGLAIVFAVTNASPFASILWAKYLTTTNVGVSKIELIVDWLKSAYQLSPKGWVFFGVVLSFGFGLWTTYRRRSHSSYFYIFSISIFLHLLGVFASNAPVNGRYLLQILPLFFVVVLVGSAQFKWLASGFALVVAIAFAQIDPGSVAGAPTQGHAQYIIKKELNRAEVILHDDQLWVTAPFRSQLVSSGCVTKECLKVARMGVQYQKNQYAFIKGDLYRVLPDQKLLTKKQTVLNSELNLDQVAINLMSSLKLRKTFDIQVVDLMKSEPINEMILNQNELSEYQMQPFFDGSKIKIQAYANRSIPGILKKGDSFYLTATLAMHDLCDYPHAFNQPRFTLIAYIDRLEIRGLNLTDVILPLFMKGYTVRVANISVPWSNEIEMIKPEFNLKKELQYQVVHYRPMGQSK
jgi:hypothetical protein